MDVDPAMAPRMTWGTYGTEPGDRLTPGCRVYALINKQLLYSFNSCPCTFALSTKCLDGVPWGGGYPLWGSRSTPRLLGLPGQPGAVGGAAGEVLAAARAPPDPLDIGVMAEGWLGWRIGLSEVVLPSSSACPGPLGDAVGRSAVLPSRTRRERECCGTGLPGGHRALPGEIVSVLDFPCSLTSPPEAPVGSLSRLSPPGPLRASLDPP